MFVWIRRALDQAAAAAGLLRAKPAVDAPMLMVDLYWQTIGPEPNWSAVAAATGYIGAILKATEGTAYKHASWLVANWRRVREAAPERYGVTWFRGAYHYLRFDSDGVDQAIHYLATMKRAGGFDHGDMLPIVDVERGKVGGVNHRASAQRIIDTTRAFSDKIRSELGRDVILYGRGAMRDLGIRDRMGCRAPWNPSYTRMMPRRSVERIGWALPDVGLWQYTDGTYCKAVTMRGVRLPAVVPGFGGGCDHSVVLLDSPEEFRRRLCAPSRQESYRMTRQNQVPILVILLAVIALTALIVALTITNTGCGAGKGDAAEPKGGSVLADVCFHALLGEGDAARPIAVCGPDEKTCGELRNAFLVDQAAIAAKLPVYAPGQCR